MANFMRKIKKKEEKQIKGLSNILKILTSQLGYQVNDQDPKDLEKMIENHLFGSVDNPKFPSLKDQGRVRDLNLNEEDLLKKFTNDYFIESFEKIKKYIDLNIKIRKMAYTKETLVDIDLLELFFSEEELQEFFKLQYDYCIDRLNFIIDIATYSKNKGYKKLYERVEKYFNKYIDKSLIKVDLLYPPKNIIHEMQLIQNRYVDSAPYIAYVQGITVKTYEDIIKAYKHYNEGQKHFVQTEYGQLINKLVENETSTDEDLKKRVDKITENFLNFSVKDNKYSLSIKEDIEKEIDSLQKEIDSLDNKGEEFLKENGALNYNKIVSFSKSSRKSAANILNELNLHYQNAFNLITLLFKYKIFKVLQQSVRNSKAAKQDIIKILNEEIKPLYQKHIPKYYYFCLKEGLNFTKKENLRKIETKFLKKGNRDSY